MGVTGEAGKKVRDLYFAHLRWVPLIVEEDKPLDPTDICFLRHVAIVPRTDGLAHLIEKSGFYGSRRGGSVHRRLATLTCEFDSVPAFFCLAGKTDTI